MSSKVEEIYSVLKFKGAEGTTAQIVANECGISYHSARRHLLKFVEKGRARIEKDPDRNNLSIFIADAIPNTPRVPHWHTDQPEIPLYQLIEKLCTTDPNEQLQVKMTKQLGGTLARVAGLAADWKLGRPVTREMVEELRIYMRAVEQRARWQSILLSRILDEPDYWSKSTAVPLWFGDPSVPFTPDDVMSLLQQANAWSNLDNNS